jgi:glucose/arabinose dehydrogenase
MKTFKAASWWTFLGGFLSNACGTVLDPNFSQSTYANAGSEVTGIAWAPDGSHRLFVTRKTGQLVIIKNGTLLPTPFATVSPIFLESECGLVGLCFDPDFILNGYVYVFATVSSNQQQILRYTAVGDIGADKTILISNLPTRGQNHDGGAIGFGPDGKLYWAIGDNGNGAGASTDLGSLASKIGRANRDGSVVTNNPFVDGPGPINDYIWARGFRNPFTFTFQPATGELWVNSAGAFYEQIFMVRAGDHAGWFYENNQPAGFIVPKIKYTTGGSDTWNITPAGAVRSNNTVTFTISTNHGFRQGEKIYIAGVTNASFNGHHFVDSTPTATTFTAAQAETNAASGGGTATTSNQGAAVTGGCFYDSTGVPAAYRGNFFYGDWASGNFMRATLNATNGVSTVDFFATGITRHIDAAIGPDGALYCGGHLGTIFRLSYNYSQQQVVATPMNIRMNEGGKTAFNVRLAMAPAQNVQINVARSSGDTNINVVSGATLTFTPANWSVPQIVQVEAARDVDSIDDIASLTLSSPGLTSETITVRVLDLPLPFALTLLSAQPGLVQVRLEGVPGKTYLFQANTALSASWITLSTNTLSATSTVLTENVNFPLRYYRARQLPD